MEHHASTKLPLGRSLTKTPTCSVVPIHQLSIFSQNFCRRKCLTWLSEDTGRFCPTVQCGAFLASKFHRQGWCHNVTAAPAQSLMTPFLEWALQHFRSRPHMPCSSAERSIETCNVSLMPTQDAEDRFVRWILSRSVEFAGCPPISCGHAVVTAAAYAGHTYCVAHGLARVAPLL